MNVRDHLQQLETTHGWAAAWALLLLAFALPLAQGVVPLLIVLVTLLMLWRHRPIRLPMADARFYRSPLPWMLLFYAWHVAGMAWTSNVGEGLFDLEVKLSLALFPLLFMMLPSTARVGGEAFLSAFIGGCAVSVPFCLGGALWRSITLPEAVWTQEFISSPFSLFMHPSYAAMYLCTALAILYLGMDPSAIRPFVRRTLAALLVIGIVLMASKIGWVVLLLLLLGIVAARWRQVALRMDAVVGTAVLVGGIVLLNTVSIYTSERIEEMRQAIVEPEHQAATTTSTAIRWLVWDAALEVIADSPLMGTGTGDVKDELLVVYAEKGYVSALEQRLNPHSQFLQSAAALGMVGLLLLLAALMVPVIHAVRAWDILSLAFLFIAVLNWGVESMLEVQAGSVYFALLSWALLLRSDRVVHLK